MTEKDGINREIDTLIQYMSQGPPSEIEIQNVLLTKTGKLIRRHTIKKIIKYQKRSKINDSNFSNMFGDKPSNELYSKV